MRQIQRRFKAGCWRAVEYERLPDGRLREHWTTLRDTNGNKLTNPANRAAVSKAISRLLAARKSQSRPVGRYTDVNAIAGLWLARATTLAPGTLLGYRTAAARICNAFGTVQLWDLSPAMLLDYQRQLLRDMRPNTVNRHMAQVHAMLGMAVDLGIIAKNPAAHVHRIAVPDKTRPRVTWEDAPALFEALPMQQHRLAVALALYAGLRAGEMVALRWSQVDAERGVIHIVNDEAAKTKSGKDRQAPILPALRWHLEQSPALADHVVINSRGVPYNAQSWSGTWAGLRRLFPVRGLRYHDLRASCATEMLRRLAPASVALILGHSSVTTTMRYYSRLNPSDAVNDALAAFSD